MTLPGFLLSTAASALFGATHAPESTMPSDPTDFTSDAALADLEDYLCDRFKARVTEKGDSVVMRGVAAAFGVAAMLGANVPTSDEFLTRFATTLGPVVFLPTGLPKGKRRLLLVLHEIGHAVAFWHEPLFMPRAYVQSGEKRADYESGAERGRIEGAFLLFGELPTAEGIHGFMQHGYACDAPDITLAQQLLDIAATATASGVISSPVGLAVRDWRLAKERGQR
ncbi:MAG: hypothetical protein JWM10_1927 [Myxococcaceae bacterium]|nr:hypothetical protein [Myxococcaceae bacterium]